MLPLYHDPQYTFRFADDRSIPRFHLEGVEAGQPVSVFSIDPGNGERLGCWRPPLLVRAAGRTSRSRSSCGPARRSSPCRETQKNE